MFRPSVGAQHVYAHLIVHWTSNANQVFLLGLSAGEALRRRHRPNVRPDLIVVILSRLDAVLSHLQPNCFLVCSVPARLWLTLCGFPHACSYDEADE